MRLGLAYAHRVLNGREATDFLTSIRTALEESPAGWLGLRAQG